MTPEEAQALLDAVAACWQWRADNYQAAFDILGIGVFSAPDVDVVLNLRALMAVIDRALEQLGPESGDFLDSLSLTAMASQLRDDA